MNDDSIAKHMYCHVLSVLLTGQKKKKKYKLWQSNCTISKWENSVNNVKWQDLTLNFQLKAFHYWIQWWHRPAQFSSKSFCSIKSTILLEIKCPQLSKPEATAARNQNSIGDRTEKKNLGRNQAQSGGHFSSGQTTQQFNSNCCKVRLEGSSGSRGLVLMAV